MPRITVQIVTFNSAPVLPTALQSLSEQTFTDFLTLIIDNASSDSTVQVARAASIPCEVNPTNIGYAGAHNQALALGDSTYVLTLNPDVRLDPGFLAMMVRAMEAHPEAGSAAGALLRVDRLDNPHLQSAASVDGAGLFMRRSRRQGLLHEGESQAKLPKQITPVWGVDGAAAFYRRVMLSDVSVNGEVFDPDFFMHKEDVDLAWRAQLRGWGCIFVPGAKAYHVRGFRPGKRTGVDPIVRKIAVRNRYLMLLKNEIGGHFWRDLPWIAAYELGILSYLLLRERASLGAFREVWALRHRMIGKRRLIQSGRRVDWHQMALWFR